MTIRPRRSVLYMPGSNARAIDKARTLPVDGVILDLEDAVAPEAKDAARQQIVNGFDTPWMSEDIDAAVAARPDAILVPKLSSTEQLEMIGQRLLDLHADLHIRLWAMIETPLAIFNVPALAAAAKDSETRLTCFVMGTNDLAKETRARLVPGRAPMVPWLATCVLAAHAYGVDLLDGVYNDLADADGFVRECAQGRDLGFDGSFAWLATTWRISFREGLHRARAKARSLRRQHWAPQQLAWPQPSWRGPECAKPGCSSSAR